MYIYILPKMGQKASRLKLFRTTGSNPQKINDGYPINIKLQYFSGK